MKAPIVGPGMVATPADWRAREVGFWPPESTNHFPVWSVSQTPATGVASVCALHEDTTGRLAQALGNWGRVVPAGSP